MVSTLREVLKLTVINVVDNESDNLSSPCQCCDPSSTDNPVMFYSDDIKRIVGAGGGSHIDFDFDQMCYAAHGLSLLLIAEYIDDNGEIQEEHLLFDAGPDGNVWKHNATKLQLDLSKINTTVLSHYHPDHSGGYRSAVQEISKARISGEPLLVVDYHSSQIVERAFQNPKTGDLIKFVPNNPSVQELTEWGATVELHDEPHNQGKDCFYVSGYIPRVTPYETGLPFHFSKVDGAWIEDPDVRDERYLAVKLKGRGVVVFSACSHAGIINVCKDALDKLKSEKLTAVIGGFHLAHRSTFKRIDETIRDLQELAPDLILAGHCTGWRAKAKLVTTFEYNSQILTVGGRYTFNSM